MISIQKLTIKTRFTILEDASFNFKTGEIYGILAPNGSGKTTLFRALNNLVPLNTGIISINNKPVNTVKKDIFYFETSDWFNKHMTGKDYLEFVKAEYNSPITISDALSKFDITEFINIPIKKYSLGMKQKLLITMYILSDADYLIMDEITNGLDDSSRTIFLSILEDLHQAGKTILISSHYKHDLQQICTQFVELKDKKLVTA